MKNLLESDQTWYMRWQCDVTVIFTLSSRVKVYVTDLKQQQIFRHVTDDTSLRYVYKAKDS